MERKGLMRSESARIVGLLIVIIVGAAVLIYGLVALSHSQSDPLIQSGIVLPAPPQSGHAQSSAPPSEVPAPAPEPARPGTVPVSPAPPVIVDDDLDDLNDIDDVDDD